MTCPFKVGDRVEDITIKVRGQYPQAIVLEVKRIQGGSYMIRVKYEDESPLLLFWPVKDYRLIQSQESNKSGFASFVKRIEG